ncbi:hypothetical protein HZH68_004838 [Vespula germanica]|uniref:NTR domain-containing protein n=2 Tax=Vespula TaxID=7451 RepID=A0A834KR09_VESGE|nr:hypothetical protein HZH68_004838 [Vespula germanica]
MVSQQQPLPTPTSPSPPLPPSPSPPSSTAFYFATNSVWPSLLGGTKCTEVDNTMVRANDGPDECLGNLREAKRRRLQHDDRCTFGFVVFTHQCGKCRASTKRLNLNKYCKRDYAILGRITDRHKKSDGSQSGSSVSGTSWIRFTLNVDFIYKKNPNSRIRRGDIPLYVHSADLACRCPKIKPNKSYLILGQESDGGGQGGLTVTQRSIVIEWRDEWHRRMRRFQRRARSCH